MKSDQELLDEYAGIALRILNPNGWLGSDPESLAKKAWDLAEEMIKQRKERMAKANPPSFVYSDDPGDRASEYIKELMRRNLQQPNPYPPYTPPPQPSTWPGTGTWGGVGQIVTSTGEETKWGDGTYRELIGAFKP